MKNKRPFGRLSFGVTLLCLGVLAGEALADAQNDPQSPGIRPSSTGGASGLEEIVVTARKREESLQDIAMSITALSAKTIEQAGLDRVSDFVELVPNVTYENAFQLGENHLTIRGITQHDEGPPPAAIVEDGVLLISPTMQFNQEEFDLERIEVLRGPQGAIYGRNAIAGAMNILTREPTNDFEMKGLVGYGNGTDLKVRAALGGPVITETLLARASVSYEDRGGQLLNSTTGRYVDHYRDSTERLRVIYKPVENWEVDLKYRYSNSAGPDPTYVIIPVDGMPNLNDLPITSNTVGNNPRTVQDASARVNWKTDVGTLSFIGAYLRGNESLFLDYDFTAANMFTAAEQFREGGVSEELRFTSRSDSSFRWIVGAYHVRSYRIKSTQAYADPGYFLSPPAPTGVANFQIIDDVNRNDFGNSSGFAEAEYDITKALELGLAIRYDDDRLWQPGTGTVAFKKWQPKVTLRYKLKDELNIYASYGEGFRSGMFNPPLRSFGNAVMLPESATTYELGIKSTFFDRRFKADVAMFYTTLKNSQEQVFDGATGNDVGSNIDDSRIQGFEVETAALLTEGLTLNIAGGVADSKILRFAVDPTVNGNKLPLVPDYTVNTGFTYERAVAADLNGFVRTDYNRIGKTAWYRDNQDIRHPINYLNCRGGLRTKDNKWSVTAWVKNWLNDRTTYKFQSIEATQHPSGDDIYYPAVGRTYGVEIGARF